MADFNRITIEGRLAFEPERRGSAATCRLANSSWRKNKTPKNDHDQYMTNWFRVVAFGAQVEALMQLAKGQIVGITNGSVELDTYTDKNGAERMSVEIHLGRDASIVRLQSFTRAGSASSSQSPQAPTSGRVPADGGSGPLPAAPTDGSFFDDSDVPF